MLKDMFIYLSFHEPRRLRLPAEPLPASCSVDALHDYCFDQAATDWFYQNWLEQVCRPYTTLLQGLVEGGANFLINVSGPLLRMMANDRGAIAVDFIRLLQHPGISLVCSDPGNSIALYLDIDLFHREMEKGRQLMFALTGRTSELAVAPLMAINAEIYHVLDQLGFRGVIVDGGWDLFQGRDPDRIYRADLDSRSPIAVGDKARGNGDRQPSLLLLPRNGDLSRRLAIALDTGTDTDNYRAVAVSQLADANCAHPGGFVLLGCAAGSSPDACTAFGRWLDELRRRGFEFADVGQVFARDGSQITSLQLPAIPAVASEYGSMRYFLGHPSQQSVFCLMRQTFWAARLSSDEAVIDLAVDAAQWDVLELLHHCTISNGNGQPPSYLTPSVMERIGTYDVPRQINEFYQNLVRAVTASYL